MFFQNYLEVALFCTYPKKGKLIFSLASSLHTHSPKILSRSTLSIMNIPKLSINTTPRLFSLRLKNLDLDQTLQTLFLPLYLIFTYKRRVRPMPPKHTL